jgi:hypothetical protein
MRSAILICSFFLVLVTGYTATPLSRTYFKGTNINAIKFRFLGSGWNWNTYDLIVKPDSIAECITVSENGEKLSHTSKISEEDFKELINILNEIDFRSLKRNYTSRATDQASVKLIVNLRHRSIEINDYGMKGTHDLQMLYSCLKDIVQHKGWVR